MTQIIYDPVPWLTPQLKLCGACVRRWEVGDDGEIRYYRYQRESAEVEDIETCPDCRRSTTR